MCYCAMINMNNYFLVSVYTKEDAGRLCLSRVVQSNVIK